MPFELPSGPSAKKRKLDDDHGSLGPEQNSFLPVIAQKWHEAWHHEQLKTEKENAVKRLAELEESKNEEINELKLQLAQEKIKTKKANTRTRSVISDLIISGSKNTKSRICEEDLLTECVYTNNTIAMGLLIQYKNGYENVKLEGYGERINTRTFYSNALYISARIVNLECMELLLYEGGLGSKIRNKNLQRQQNVLFDLVNFKNKHDWQSHKRNLNCKTNYAWKNLLEMLCLILSFDPEHNIINDRDMNGMTVLHHAAREKNLNSVNFMGALCSVAKDSNHTTNLITRTYEDLLDRNRKDVFEHGSLHFSQTPLHMAMRARELEGLMFLAPVNRIVPRGQQKLMKTSANELPQNQEKIVKILLEHGADPKVGDQFQNNFLHYVAAYGLVKKYADSMLSFDSVLKEEVIPFGGGIHWPKVLFVNKTNEFGDTPLIFGLQLVWDHDEDLMLETVKKLHENGADLNHKNNFGYSALLISKMRNLQKITEFLESNGAVIDLDTHLLLKIVKSYGFDKYGCVHNKSSVYRSPFDTTSTCEYLRKLARMDLGRFSEEYNYGSKYCHFTYFDDDTDMSKFKIRVKRFSSLKSISEFITTDPELKQRYVMEFGNGRIFKEDVCLICLTDAPERTFLPCGHEAICKDCLAMSDFKKCPLCKQKIEIVL